MRNWFPKIRGAVSTGRRTGGSSQVPTPPPEPFHGRLNFYHPVGSGLVPPRQPELKLIKYLEEGDK